MTHEDKWFTPNIRYGAELGYVMLQLPHIELPAFHYEGIAYEPKQELHCSLLCTRKLADLFQDFESADDAIASFVEAFVQTHPIIFKSFADIVYVCEENDVKSIIIGVRAWGVTELYAALRTSFSELAQLPDPALHVTLYKYNHQFGIGIQSEEQLRAICRPISFDLLPKKLQEQL
jgi:hypothetical protein